LTSIFRGVSIANTALVVYLSLIDCLSGLDIDMVTSAGTATLTIEVALDTGGQNFATVDIIAAAAAIVKHYGRDTVGGTTALAPMSFPLVRITAGFAGVSNTTTLVISAK